MKKNLKKSLALVLTLITSVSVLAGCGNQQTETKESFTSSAVSQEESSVSTEVSKEVELEPVTLKWYVNGKEKEGTKDVVEAFNSKLAEVLPNTTVEFFFESDYKANWPLVIAGGEKIDIAWAGWSTPYMQDVIDGNIMAITNLIEEYAPNIVAEMEIWKQPFATAMYEGELYGIPNIQPIVAEAQSFILNEKFSTIIDEEAFLDNIRSNKKLTKELLDIIDTGIQKAIDEGKYKVGELTWAPDEGIIGAATRGYMMIGAEINRMWFDPEADHPIAMYLWELPEFQMVAERIAEWYDKGWITETQALGQMPEATEKTIGFTANWNANWANADERGYVFVNNTNKPDTYTVLSNKPMEGYIGMTNFGSENTYNVIPYTSENPERAIMLLNLLHDEPGTVGNDLANLLCYGFEENSEEAKKYGWFNYTAVEEDGQLMTDKSTRGERADMHSVSNYVVTNTYKVMHSGSNSTKAKSKEYAMNYFNNTVPQLKETAVAYMVADFTAVSGELANMQTVHNEYYDQIKFGSGGVEKFKILYEEAMGRFKEAGLENVKNELQSQIDAYIAK